jgi:hypothetical protein
MAWWVSTGTALPVTFYQFLYYAMKYFLKTNRVGRSALRPIGPYEARSVVGFMLRITYLNRIFNKIIP